MLQSVGAKLVNLTNGTAFLQSTTTIQALQGNNLTLGETFTGLVLALNPLRCSASCQLPAVPARKR